MKKKSASFTILTILCFVFGFLNQLAISPKKSKFPRLTGPYLGQTPPGDKPELFAPGIIPDVGSEHTAVMFTPDGKEAFWSRIMNPGQQPRCMVIMHVRQENGIWSKPELAPFNIGVNNFISSISPDGKRLYFLARAPIKDGEIPGRFYAGWVVFKTDSGWSKPRLTKEALGWNVDFSHLQETNSGNRYFSGNLKGVEREVGFFISRYVKGKYQTPEPLGKSINSKHLDYAFHVDPDEAFIVFTSHRPGGYVGSELYISYRQPDHTWGPSINLGAKINSIYEGGTNWANLSPDGRYLFFIASIEAYNKPLIEEGTYGKLRATAVSVNNGYSKTYWVNTSFIETLRSKNEKKESK